MGEFEFFIALLGIAWGILSIILFFKIWVMTNDVKSIKDYLLSSHTTQLVSSKTESINTTKSDELKVDDFVYSYSKERRVLIKEIVGKGVYRCVDPTTNQDEGIFNEDDLTKN